MGEGMRHVGTCEEGCSKLEEGSIVGEDEDPRRGMLREVRHREGRVFTAMPTRGKRREFSQST
jgi:hypothetical protein